MDDRIGEIVMDYDVYERLNAYSLRHRLSLRYVANKLLDDALTAAGFPTHKETGDKED